MNSEHGGDIYNNNNILYDFSANFNPLGIPENVINVLKNSVDEWDKYPDPYCRKLTEKIGSNENFCTENIVCGNGAADLIYRIIQAFKPEKSVICTPSFSEYQKALTAFGSKIIAYGLSEKNDFILDIGITELFTENIDMLILCSPNNPTGKTINTEILKKICKKCIEKNIIFLCDECFMNFVKDGENKSVRNFMNKNIIILKAFTKFYAMAGLRLGYALFGNAEYAEKIRKTGQFWSVSTPAQIAGIAALDEKKYIQKTFEIVENERYFLLNELSKMNFKVYDPDANFILFKSDLPLDVLLLKHGILIRSCANFDGLGKDFFRIAVRSHHENIALIKALRSVLNG